MRGPQALHMLSAAAQPSIPELSNSKYRNGLKAKEIAIVPTAVKSVRIIVDKKYLKNALLILLFFPGS